MAVGAAPPSPPTVGTSHPIAPVALYPVVPEQTTLSAKAAPPARPLLPRRGPATVQPTRLPRAPLAVAAKATPPPPVAKAATHLPRPPSTTPHIHPAVRALVAKAVAAAAAAGPPPAPPKNDLPAAVQVRLLVARALSAVAAAELGYALGPPHVCRVARYKRAAQAAGAGAAAHVPTRRTLAPPPASLEATLGPPKLSRLQREAAEWAAVPRRQAKFVR